MDTPVLYTYHFYITIQGEPETFRPLFEFLEEISARQVSAEYPIWFCNALADKHDHYIARLAKIFKAIQIQRQGGTITLPYWNILLMGPFGHSGFSGGKLSV